MKRKYIIDNIVSSMDIDQRKQQLNRLLEIPKLEQKSKEWYDARQCIVTASDFAQALGKGKFGSQKQFYKKKVEPDESSNGGGVVNPFFKWGNMFESVAISIYSRLHHDTVVHEFGLILHPRKKFFGASPDGITDEGIMVEIKCPKKRKIDGEVPLQYYYQIQGQLDVCDLDVCDYFECEFEQIEDRDDFFSFCTDFEFWGAIDELDDGKIRYSKLNADVDELKSWKIEGKPLYWVLKKFNINRVEKDPIFIEQNMNELEKVWEKVVFYRNNKEAYQLEVEQKFSIVTEALCAKDAKPNEEPMIKLSKYAFLE
jgi:putative phage-type endonuclease